MQTKQPRFTSRLNKPMYLGMSILDITKTFMCEFWCDYIKPKYQDRTKLCYMDTESFIIHIKTVDFYGDSDNDAEKQFDISSYDEDGKISLPISKNRKVIGFLYQAQSKNMCILNG